MVSKDRLPPNQPHQRRHAERRDGPGEFGDPVCGQPCEEGSLQARSSTGVRSEERVVPSPEREERVAS